MMIVTLSETVCRYIQENDRLQRQQNSTAWIKETSNALQLLEKEIAQLVALVAVLQICLSADNLNKMYNQIDNSTAQIRQLQDNFSKETYQQSKSILALYHEIKKRIQEAQSFWKGYAEGQTKEIFDLFNLVNHLPEVEAQRVVYDTLSIAIQQATLKAPQTLTQLQDFKKRIEEFSAQLDTIDGLNEQVKTFLQRTLKGQATIADITDDVLQWCRQGDHAQAFAVHFAK